MKKNKFKISISQETKLLFVEMVFFAPAVIYWLSALVYVSLGTDYLFDAILLPMSESVLGILAILVAITLMPGIGAFGAWALWKTNGNKVGMPLMVTGIVLAMGGLISVIVKS